MILKWPALLICPECGPGQDHPQPFQNAAGQWLCGKCGFIDQRATVMESVEASGLMTPRPEANTDPPTVSGDLTVARRTEAMTAG